MMDRRIKVAWALGLLALGHPLHAQAPGAADALSLQDVRLARIAERMLQANGPLCRRQMLLTGLVIHSRDQYPPDTAQDFANGPVAVAAVLPGSPAHLAGLRAGDALVAVGSSRVSEMRAGDEAPLRDAVFAALADTRTDGPLTLTVSRGGAERTIALDGKPGCRALVEVRAVSGLTARSDGRVVQIDYGLAAAADDRQLAVIFAHELAHVVLEHRRRLEAAGVVKGLLGEFGRNRELNRQVEVEADRLSVHLLANAGHDPADAPAFWRSSLGRRAGNPLIGSMVYPSAEQRARLLEREIADYLPAGTAPSWPGHLLDRRERPFRR